MGAWGTAIKSNDTSSDIYADFFDLYNEGREPAEIAKKLIKDNKEILSDQDDSSNFWFSLALALWETKNLDQETFKKVKEIIESGKDLQNWKELGGDDADINKRKIVLKNFLEKISTEKDKPKPRKKKKQREPIFEKGTCLSFRLINGNYGGAVVLEADKKTGYGYNLIVTTRINQSTKPTKKDFENANVLVLSYGNWDNQPKVSWYFPDRFHKEYSELFEVVDNIQVDINYNPNGSEIKATFSGCWQHIIEYVTTQFNYERKNRETKSFPLAELINKKKWWKL